MEIHLVSHRHCHRLHCHSCNIFILFYFLSTCDLVLLSCAKISAKRKGQRIQWQVLRSSQPRHDTKFIFFFLFSFLFPSFVSSFIFFLYLSFFFFFYKSTIRPFPNVTPRFTSNHEPTLLIIPRTIIIINTLSLSCIFSLARSLALSLSLFLTSSFLLVLSIHSFFSSFFLHTQITL